MVKAEQNAVLHRTDKTWVKTKTACEIQCHRFERREGLPSCFNSFLISFLLKASNSWEPFLGGAPSVVRARISIIPPRQQFVKRKVIQNNLFILSHFRHFANRLFKAYLVYYIMSRGNGEFPSDRKKLSEIENFLLTKPTRCDIIRVSMRGG